jgi:4'-phosphopantetheinyl transferase
LRQLLAPLLAVPADQIEFSIGAHGKPMLAGTAATADIQFNLSHSDDLGLAGWAKARAIGVDIERWRATRDEGALVRRFFSVHENAAYEALALERRTEGFFNCWTRKEAYVKAVGRGLGLALDSFDVALESGVAAPLLRPSALCNDGRRWSLAAPEAIAGVSMAVVLEAENLHLRAIKSA